MSVAGILVAAGRSERFHASTSAAVGPTAISKALLEVDGLTLLAHAARRMFAGGVRTLVIVHPVGQEDVFRAAIDPVLNGARVVLVPGGQERTDSVRAGFAACPSDAEVIAIHDAARPFVPATVIRAALGAVLASQTVLAAAPYVPIVDTVKRVERGAASIGGRIDLLGTVDREELVCVQTPQVLRREPLQIALAQPGSASDELVLVERLRDGGLLEGRIVLIPGDAAGRKLTHASDLALLRDLAEGSGPTSQRHAGLDDGTAA
jgi:2-C-methyl-D-erythritol 4-phosphate cytidylyltransferase